MSSIKRRVLLLLTAAVMAIVMVAGPTAGAALAESPHKDKQGQPKWA
jgi:hypothetical protein